MKTFFRRSILSGLVLIGFYSLLWLGAATIFENRVLAAVQAGNDNATSFSYGKHRNGGYPFELRETFRDVKIVAKPNVTLTSDRLRLTMEPRNPVRTKVFAPHGFKIELPENSLLGEAKELRGETDFDHGHLKGLSLAATDISLTGLLSGHPIKIGTLIFHTAAPNNDDAGRPLIVNALQINLPDNPVTALGSSINRLTLEASILGHVSELSRESLSNWRDSGGTMEISSFSVDWGLLGLGLGGTAALDANLQPIGAFQTKITGYLKIVQALAAAGSISTKSALLIDAALDQLAKPVGDPPVPTIDVPVTVQDRTVYVTSLKLCSMPDFGLQ